MWIRSPLCIAVMYLCHWQVFSEVNTIKSIMCPFDLPAWGLSFLETHEWNSKCLALRTRWMCRNLVCFGSLQASHEVENWFWRRSQFHSHYKRVCRLSTHLKPEMLRMFYLQTQMCLFYRLVPGTTLFSVALVKLPSYYVNVHVLQHVLVPVSTKNN